MDIFAKSRMRLLAIWIIPGRTTLTFYWKTEAEMPPISLNDHSNVFITGNFTSSLLESQSLQTFWFWRWLKTS